MATRPPARIKSASIPAPYNPLDMPDGSSVEFIAIGMEEFDAEREIFSRGAWITQNVRALRVHTDLTTPVFGAPFIDIFAGRTIALLKAWFAKVGFPARVRLTARGREPEKWYEVEVGRVAASE
jgi:hypothetical protein